MQIFWVPLSFSVNFRGILFGPSQKFMKFPKHNQGTNTWNYLWTRKSWVYSYSEIFLRPIPNVVLQAFYCSINSRSTAKSPGGGYSKKFYTGRLRPEVQPLTLLYTIFSEKVPLSYIFYWKKAPLSYTFLRRLMNKSLKQEVFLPFFSRST